MLQPRRIKQESPIHPRTCQVNCHILTAAGGGESAAEVHGLADLQAVGVQGGAGVVAQFRPGAVELAADVGAGQADRAVGAVPVAVNPSCAVPPRCSRCDVGAGQADRAVGAVAGGNPPQTCPGRLQAVGVQGGAGVVAQFRPGAVELAADVGAGQADRAVGAVAGGGEPAAEEHALADLQAVGVQGGAGVVAQFRPGAVELAADMGAEQVDSSVGAVADDPCSGQQERAAGETFGIQG